MRIQIAIILLFVPFFMNGQESKKEESRFSVGVNFSPNYSYRILSYPENLQPWVDARGDMEQPAFGFNAGIASRYLLLPKLEIELGLQFSRQTTNMKNLLFVNNTGEPVGYADGQYRYHYLEIPLRLNYLFIDKQFFGYITAGASVNIFLNDKFKVRINFDNGNKEDSNEETGFTDFNETCFGLIGGFGVGYHLNPKFDVRVEPLFRYSLTPVFVSPIEQNNYSIGCQLGLNMKF